MRDQISLSDFHNAYSVINSNGAINIIADSPPPELPDTFANGATLPSAAQPTNEIVKQETDGSDEIVKQETDGSDNSPTQDTLTGQEQARLNSLKAMLNASNARYEQVTRNRRPKFSAGLEIMIVSGDHVGKVGVVLDADYIANRALISLSDQESPHWIDFKSLGHAN